ncbi:MAG: hypothetical protein K0U72_06950 [Gammaproteobacteria bacterium]|nr:hypothetical protein [Gammaproteobacteria bacterium]
MIDLTLDILSAAAFLALGFFVIGLIHLGIGLNRASHMERERARIACGGSFWNAIFGVAADDEISFQDFRRQHGIGIRIDKKSKKQSLVYQSTISEEGISQLLD